MKQKLGFLSIVVTLFFSMSVQVMADTIGFIDTDRVLSNFTDFQSVNKQYQEKSKVFKTRVEAMEKDLMAKKLEIKDEEKFKEIVEKSQQELMPAQQELQQLQMEIQVKVMGRVNVLIKDLAQQYNIDVVLDRKSVLYGGFDLTDFVTERLNR